MVNNVKSVEVAHHQCRILKATLIPAVIIHSNHSFLGRHIVFLLPSRTSSACVRLRAPVCVCACANLHMQLDVP